MSNLIDIYNPMDFFWSTRLEPVECHCIDKEIDLIQFEAIEEEISIKEK
jgi:hypothetical protein